MAVIFRPTMKLAAKMRVQLEYIPLETNPIRRLGDWYAIEVNVSHLRLILCVSEHARLPIVIEAAPYKSIPERLPLALEKLLRRIEIPEDKITRELSQMNHVRFGKSLNRSITGTLNQYKLDLEWGFYGSKPPQTLDDCTMRLADGICMPLKEKVPIKAAQNLFLKPHLQLVH